jgi:hypothetical protein
MYDDEPLTAQEIESGRLVWPPYIIGGTSTGKLSERQARQIRNNYGAKLSMIDHHFGRILDELDAQGLWDDTAVIVCTDHGHYLGERRSAGDPGSDDRPDIWGKPGIPQFEPLGHTPLMIHWPGAARREFEALTTNVDLHATIADAFGVESAHRTHGRSLVPLLDGSVDSVRDWAIGGVWGNWVQVTDGRRKYARAPVDANMPLSMWSNRWSTMPIGGGLERFRTFPNPDRRAVLDYMPGSDVPVIRQPFAAGDPLPFWAGGARNEGRHHLYDLAVDPDEAENRRDDARMETAMVELLRSALLDVDAPAEQLARLGIA